MKSSSYQPSNNPDDRERKTANFSTLDSMYNDTTYNLTIREGSRVNAYWRLHFSFIAPKSI